MEISAEKLRGPTAATLIGVIGPVMWAMNVPLMRAVVEGFGVAPGECLLYAVATVALFLSVGVPDWRKADRRYLFWGLSSAVACTVCLVLAIYLSTGGAQTMEVGMVNYLWPATTVVAAVLFTGVRATWMLAPGMVLCIASVFWIISGGAFSFSAFFSHAADNPLSYVLALGAALFWTAYSIFTKLWGRGQNFSTVIFAADTLVFGLMWAAGFGGEMSVTVKGAVSVLAGGIAAGLAYGCWTHGMLYGSVPVLSVASYFTPVMSCVFGVIWIGASLTQSFWLGTAVLVVGSLICWRATASQPASHRREVRR